MQGHIRYDSPKVTGVFSPKRHCDETSQGRGNAVEAIFFATAILLSLTIDLVMIVLVSGSALLVVRSRKFNL